MSPERRDPARFRRLADWQIVVGLIVSIGGIVWAVSAYPLRWQKTCDQMDLITPQVWKNKEDIQGVRLNMAVINAQYQNIHEDLAVLKARSKQ